MADVALPSKPQAIALPLPALSSLRINHSLAAVSPVTQQGSYDYDRIVKSGQVLKRTRKTKSWKPIFMVLRPNLLSIYKDSTESKLRHQINLSELTTVARQKDPKRRDKHVFGLFSPSRNYHLEASSDQEAQQWVEAIRQEARIGEDEEEMHLMSPGGEDGGASFRGLGKNISERIRPPPHDERLDDSTSEGEPAQPSSSSFSVPRRRGPPKNGPRRPSHAESSGPERASFSDFSDTAATPGARMSALSLSQNDARPPTSSALQQTSNGSVYGQAPTRPSAGTRNFSQLSGPGNSAESSAKTASIPSQDDERVVAHGWIYLLKSKSGVRQWKKVWMVLRPKSLGLYKNEEEYMPQLVLPFHSIIDVVEIDPISKSKTACMQIICDERNLRFCAFDEDSLARWLGAFKSLLSRRRAKAATNVGAVAVQSTS